MAGFFLLNLYMPLTSPESISVSLCALIAKAWMRASRRPFSSIASLYCRFVYVRSASNCCKWISRFFSCNPWNILLSNCLYTKFHKLPQFLTMLVLKLHSINKLFHSNKICVQFLLVIRTSDAHASRTYLSNIPIEYRSCSLTADDPVQVVFNPGLT